MRNHSKFDDEPVFLSLGFIVPLHMQSILNDYMSTFSTNPANEMRGQAYHILLLR